MKIDATTVTESSTWGLVFIVEEFMTACEGYETLDDLQDDWYDMASIYADTARKLGYNPPEGFTK